MKPLNWYFEIKQETSPTLLFRVHAETYLLAEEKLITYLDNKKIPHPAWVEGYSSKNYKAMNPDAMKLAINID